jgi:predicted membrane chloride channel (bestrophin family)
LRFARDFTVDPFGIVGIVLALILSRFHVTGDRNIWADRWKI